MTEPKTHTLDAPGAVLPVVECVPLGSAIETIPWNIVSEKA